MKSMNKTSRAVEEVFYEDYWGNLSQFPEELRHEIYTIAESKAKQRYLIKALSSIEAWNEIVRDYLVPESIKIFVGSGIPALFTYEVVSSFTHDTILSGMAALFVYGGFAKWGYSQLRRKIEYMHSKIRKAKRRDAESWLESEKDEIVQYLYKKLESLEKQDETSSKNLNIHK